MEIIETIRWSGNSQIHTGKFRILIGEVAFNLPGRGGLTTTRKAAEISRLWNSGISAGEISEITGCRLV
jgi:hypothetical protein